MFLDRFHEVPPPPVDPVELVRQHRARRRMWSFTSIAAVFLVGVAVGSWWLVTRPADAGLSANTPNVNASTAVTDTMVNPDDTDKDGLSDELEKIYGTDVRKTDSDGDTFSDGTEVDNGFEPLNPGDKVRMVDLGLVSRLYERTPAAVVISSGIASSDKERYYLVFDGASTAYYQADGSVAAQCLSGIELSGACSSLPNEVRTDFSRSFLGGVSSDSYYIPF